MTKSNPRRGLSLKPNFTVRVTLAVPVTSGAISRSRGGMRAVDAFGGAMRIVPKRSTPFFPVPRKNGRSSMPYTSPSFSKGPTAKLDAVPRREEHLLGCDGSLDESPVGADDLERQTAEGEA